MYTRILLPTDGSADSHRAVEYVIRLAEAHRAGVVVLEAIESADEVYKRASAAGWVPSGTGFLTDENVAALIASERAAAGHHTTSIREELERAGISDVECRIAEGPPGPQIVALAEETQCDTIVLASHGRSGVTRLLLGSVADYVACHASCPVLLVPARAKGSG